MADSANGRKPSVNTNDQVYWAHVTPNNGSIRFDRFFNLSRYWLAMDEHTPGNGIDAGPYSIDAPAMKAGADVSTLAAAKTSLQAGQYGVTANKDGSVDIAINWGSRTASHGFYQYWDDVTNNLVKNANGIIEYYAGSFRFDFSEHDQAQTASVTWDSTNMDVPEAGRHGTTALSNSIASNLGSGQAEIIYAKNADGVTGSVDPQIGDYDSIGKAAANGFSRNDYEFAGWNTQADGKGKTVKPGDGITFPGEGQIMTLYAQWKAQPATLVYDANAKDATGTTAEQKGVTDQNVPVRDNGFKRSDYSFVSWNTQADGKGKTYRKGDQYTLPAGTSTLYAQWKQIPATVHYDPNGGQGYMDDHKGFVGDTPEAGDNKFTNKDECKEFAGWNTQADGKGKTYQSKDQVDPLTGDITLYAQWETKDNCPAAKPGELGHTGSSVLPYAFSAVLLLLALAPLVLRRQRHGQHA